MLCDMFQILLIPFKTGIAYHFHDPDKSKLSIDNVYTFVNISSRSTAPTSIARRPFVPFRSFRFVHFVPSCLCGSNAQSPPYPGHAISTRATKIRPTPTHCSRVRRSRRKTKASSTVTGLASEPITATTPGESDPRPRLKASPPIW